MKIPVHVYRYDWDYSLNNHMGGDRFDYDLPISEICFSTAEGQVWVGENDDWRGVRGPRDLRRYKDAYEKWGITVSCALGPHGLNPVKEAINAAAALSITQKGFVNFEVNSTAWQGPLSNIRTYAEVLRSICPDAELGVTVNTADSIHVGHWYPYVDTLWQPAYYGEGSGGSDAEDPVAKVREIAMYANANAQGKRIGIQLWGLDRNATRTKNIIKAARSHGADLMVFRRQIWCNESIEAIRSL